MQGLGSQRSGVCSKLLQLSSVPCRIDPSKHDFPCIDGCDVWIEPQAELRFVQQSAVDHAVKRVHLCCVEVVGVEKVLLWSQTLQQDRSQRQPMLKVQHESKQQIMA